VEMGHFQGVRGARGSQGAGKLTLRLVCCSAAELAMSAPPVSMFSIWQIAALHFERDFISGS